MKEAEKIKKIADAKKDIDKINEVLSDTSLSFHKKANMVYEDIVKNIDYAPYIGAGKLGANMVGNIPFSQLDFNTKRKALRIIRTAITSYATVTATEKTD